MTVQHEVWPGQVVTAAAPPVVELEHVGVRLGKRTVLRDVTFSLAPGEFMGVIGSNGAGKTTLLRVLLGLVRPDHGRAEVFGHTPRRGDGAIGYVPQHQNFHEDLPLRARDFVRLGIDGTRWGVPFGDDGYERRIDDALRAVRAESYADSPVGRLSGGEQQRLALAQALVGNPRLLLLDEPLANLDMRSRRDVVSLVREVSTERQIAVLFVAHDVNPLLQSLDRVLYLANGNAVCGTVDEVIRGEVMTRLYGFPVDVVRADGHVLVVGAADDNDCCHD